ncbi:MAG: hypothetical protein ACREQ8_02850 [Woeseiaceae bacterium]
MSKKRHADTIDELDESTYNLLGSRVSKLAIHKAGKNRFRERRANDGQDQNALPQKVKRMRDRPD